MLERTRDKEDFMAVDQTVPVRVGVVGVGEEVVFSGNDFFTVFKPVVVRVKHAGACGIGFTFPGEACTRFLQVTQAVGIRVRVGGVGATAAAHGGELLEV